MTGYRYLSPWDMRKIVHKYVLRDKWLQNIKWGIVDAYAMSKISSKTLSPKGGEGKSEVLSMYKNGAEIKIDYKYPKRQEIFHFKESALGKNRDFYYARDIIYESSHYGIRGVYTLGENYFIIDELPESSLPSTISLATSWNMPENSTALGLTGWEQFVFEGTTPNFASTGFPAVSRIQIAVAGASTVTKETSDEKAKFEVREDAFIKTAHLTYENKLEQIQFMITQIKAGDESINFPIESSQTQDIASISGGMILERNYSDGTIDLVVYNPKMTSFTVDGITSSAKVMILSSDNSGNWQSGRLFNSSTAPTFVGYTPTPTVLTSGGTTDVGFQYDVTF